MASRLNGSQSASVRNPRRRGRREDAEDLVNLPLQPARKRHKTSPNGTLSPPLHVVPAKGQHSPASQLNAPLWQRQASLDDSKLDILVENEKFTVEQLPGLPQELRGRNEGKWLHYMLLKSR